MPVWRARRIAQAVLGSPRDVVDHIDATVAEVAHQVGPAVLDRILDEAMTLLYPEQRETEQLEALDARYATLDERSINHTGIVDMALRGDWADLHDFDQALSEVAAALARTGVSEPLDVRRSMAVGVLADPQRAHALLTGGDQPKPRRHLVLYLHLSEAALTGRDLLAHHETGRPMLAQQVADWAGRTDTQITVKPVIDLNDNPHDHDHHLDDEPGPYEVPDRLKEKIGLLTKTCVFPWCTRPARRCDGACIEPVEMTTSRPTTRADRPASATSPPSADILG